MSFVSNQFSQMGNEGTARLDAEIERLRAELANETRLWALDIERRVSAEVAATRLTAELAEWRDLSNGGALGRRAEKAEAALARVRELCGNPRLNDYADLRALRTELLAAIEEQT